MKHAIRTALLSVTLATGIAASWQASAHFDDKEPLQSYRQSYFTMLAMNLGPVGAMLKGEMPWNDTALQGYADDLAALGTLDIMRGFAPGSEQGTTRAKPEIWKNLADFEGKFQDLQTAAVALQEAARQGDKKAIGMSVGAVGKACKACHDDYKSKDYLY